MLELRTNWNEIKSLVSLTQFQIQAIAKACSRCPTIRLIEFAEGENPDESYVGIYGSSNEIPAILTIDVNGKWSVPAEIPWVLGIQAEDFIETVTD